MTNKISPNNAAALLNRLGADKEHLEMLKRKDEERKEIERVSGIEQKELLNELSSKGIKVSDVWDLVNSKKSYADAIPVLVKHLGLNYSEKTKEGIIRALTVKEAKGFAGTALIKLFMRLPVENYYLRWAIGNALIVVAGKDEIDDILAIINDKANGPVRGIFVKGLIKMKSERVEYALIDLIYDKEITPWVLDALGKFKSIKAKEQIVRLLNDPSPEIQKKAKKVLNLMSNFNR